MNRLQIIANMTELTNSAPNNPEKCWVLKNYLYFNVKTNQKPLLKKFLNKELSHIWYTGLVNYRTHSVRFLILSSILPKFFGSRSPLLLHKADLFFLIRQKDNRKVG